MPPSSTSSSETVTGSGPLAVAGGMESLPPARHHGLARVFGDDGPWKLLLRCIAFGLLFVLVTQAFRLFGLAFPNIPVPDGHGDTMYLAYDDTNYDHFRYAFEKDDGPIAFAKKADVLLLGNSRLMLGIAPFEFEKYLKPQGVSFHYMGFGQGESHALAKRIIQKERIKPKLVIVNADGAYFRPEYSGFTNWMLGLGEKDPADALAYIKSHHYESDHWRAWMGIAPAPQLQKYYMKLEHTRLPMIYRSLERGFWIIASPEIAYKESMQVWKKEGPLPIIPRDKSRMVANGKKFVEMFRKQGTEVVFIVVPNIDHNAEIAHLVGDDMGVSVVDVPWDRYFVFDTSHLDLQSAERYTNAVMPLVVETPEWKRAFGNRK